MPMLPAFDLEFLGHKAPNHRISSEGGVICVVVPGYQLPRGFTQSASDLLLRLAPGYPDVPPDMGGSIRRYAVPMVRKFLQRRHRRGIWDGSGNGGRAICYLGNGVRGSIPWRAILR